MTILLKKESEGWTRLYTRSLAILGCSMSIVLTCFYGINKHFKSDPVALSFQSVVLFHYDLCFVYTEMFVSVTIEKFYFALFLALNYFSFQLWKNINNSTETYLSHKQQWKSSDMPIAVF